jgi:hypothetical protein
MANNAWGELSWNAGLWGEQNDSIVSLSGFGLNISEGQANYTPGEGWGRFTWGSLGWGVNYANENVQLTGSQLNLSEGEVAVSGEIREGWGVYTWGLVPWGGEQDPEIGVLGQQLNTSLGSLSFVITGNTDLIGQQLNISQGDAEGFASFTAEVTGQQLNISLNSITPLANANVDVSGEQLNVTEGEVDPSPDANVIGIGMTIDLAVGTVVIGTGNVTLTGEQINISQGTAIGDANTIAQVSSIAQVGWGVVGWGTQAWNDTEVDISMTIAEGEVDPSPDATVVGIGMTIDLAIGTVVIGTGNVTLTGEQINIAQGSVEATPNTLVSVTGIGLNIAVGTVFAGGTSIVELTGNGLTIALNSINNQIWTEINTGTDATWTEIDTAA